MSWRALLTVLVCALSVCTAQALSPRLFVVFFGYAKCELTAEARQVLADYALAHREDEWGAMLSSHADTAETAAKLTVSKCRGEAVAQALMELGYAAEKISICDKADRELWVQTERDTKEPQNRRVHIDPFYVAEPDPGNCTRPQPRPPREETK